MFDINRSKAAPTRSNERLSIRSIHWYLSQNFAYIQDKSPHKIIMDLVVSSDAAMLAVFPEKCEQVEIIDDIERELVRISADMKALTVIKLHDAKKS